MLIYTFNARLTERRSGQGFANGGFWLTNQNAFQSLYVTTFTDTCLCKG